LSIAEASSACLFSIQYGGWHLQTNRGSMIAELKEIYKTHIQIAAK